MPHSKHAFLISFPGSFLFLFCSRQENELLFLHSKNGRLRRERERSSVMSVIAPRWQFIRPSLSPFNENNSYVFVHSISIILRENLPTRSMMLQLRSLSFAGTDGEPARERDMFTSAGKMEPISEKPFVKFGYRCFSFSVVQGSARVQFNGCVKSQAHATFANPHQTCVETFLRMTLKMLRCPPL